MKHTIIISILFILLLSGCTTQAPTDTASTSGISPSQENTQKNPDLIELDGVSFQASTDYQYRLEETPFASFEEYADYVENNLIIELVQANQQNKLTEAEVNTELKKFEGHYSFERKKVNGFDVLVHRRDFFGIIGDIYEAHVYLENGKVLILADELDHERLDNVLSTISK